LIINFSLIIDTFVAATINAKRSTNDQRSTFNDQRRVQSGYGFSP